MYKTFCEWLILNESVTFSVKDFSPNRVQNLYWLGVAVEQDLHRNFGPDYEGFKYQRFDIDGLDTEGTEGVMNFYAGDLESDVLKKILKAIPYYLTEHGAKVTGLVKQETSRMFKVPVYRFPVKLRVVKQNAPPELNVAQERAYTLIADLLQIAPPHEWEMGVISARELLMKLGSVSQFAKDMTLQAPSQNTEMGKALHFDAGFSADQIERYLFTLEAMAKWAIENDYDEIQWH